jgi:hypothetical protein
MEKSGREFKDCGRFAPHQVPLPKSNGASKTGKRKCLKLKPSGIAA